MGSVLARAVLIVAAVAAVAWLAVSLRVVTLEEEGNQAFERARQGPLGQERIDRAREALRDAGELSADTAPRLIEGRLLAALGDRDQAANLALMVLAEEPENVDAWFLAYVSAGNPQGLALTKRRVQQLNPLLGDQLE